MVVFSNKNSFCLHVQLAPFCIKTNLRENRLFAARWALDGEKGSQDVKIYAEKRTKSIDELTSGWEEKLINSQFYKKTSGQENELASGWEVKLIRRQEISILAFSSEQVYIKIMYATCISRYQRGYMQSVCSKQPASINTKMSLLDTFSPLQT